MRNRQVSLRLRKTKGKAGRIPASYATTKIQNRVTNQDFEDTCYMNYKENALCYDEYCRLRESVGWTNYPRTQTEKSLKSCAYTVVAEKDNQAVGMGRLIGDGMYYMIVDIVVQPAYQQMGIGSKILHMMIEYVDRETPVGGRSSIQLIAEKGNEAFYETRGFKTLPHEFCGSGMRKVICK